MNAALRKPKMTVDDYLAWAAAQPGEVHAELWDGVIVAQSAQRLSHIRTKVAVAVALANALAKAGLECHALGDGATVRINDTTAFEPDAMVHCGPRLPGDAFEVPNPVIVVEVLSPGSEKREMGEKLAGYFNVPSVWHYLIVDPDECFVIHHRRTADGLAPPLILREGALHLDPPGIGIELAAIFQ
jgi:Uma2 family endonuclease